VVKSIVREDEPPLLQLRGRTSIMHKVCVLPVRGGIAAQHAQQQVLL
jgi:hypothetical protein